MDVFIIYVFKKVLKDKFCRGGFLICVVYVGVDILKIVEILLSIENDKFLW